MRQRHIPDLCKTIISATAACSCPPSAILYPLASLSCCSQMGSEPASVASGSVPQGPASVVVWESGLHHCPGILPAASPQFSLLPGSLNSLQGLDIRVLFAPRRLGRRYINLSDPVLSGVLATPTLALPTVPIKRAPQVPHASLRGL